jgi:hypothetical protein
MLTKIRIIIQLSIKFLIEEGILIEKKNYIKTEKRNKKDEFYYKNIFRLKKNLKTKTKVVFNIDYKFFRHPTRTIEYSVPIKRIIINNGKAETEENVLIKTIISGPTFIRAELFNKASPLGIEPFKIKNKNLVKIFSETKFYPDIDFIELLKKEHFNHLNINEIRSEIKNTKLKLKNIYEETNWDEDTIQLQQELQKQLSKKREEEKIFIFLNNDWQDFYHFSSNQDYRGRKYYCSPLTFTHFKLSRYCFHFGSGGKIQESYFD